jgi:hypothetical protein
MESKKATMFQHLRAGHSPSGNPQRVFVLLNKEGGIVDTIDEGYTGVPAACRGLIELHSVNISRADYHNYLRIGKEKAGAK